MTRPQQERQKKKKKKGLISQTTTLHVNKQRRNFISQFLNLDMVHWNSNSGGFANDIWQSKLVGIIPIKTEGRQIHFFKRRSRCRVVEWPTAHRWWRGKIRGWDTFKLRLSHKMTRLLLCMFSEICVLGPGQTSNLSWDEPNLVY